jgi:glutamate synthase domain-containing protein 2
MVASGALAVGNAILMIMGANIGTTVTNTLVSLGCVSHKNEFQCQNRAPGVGITRGLGTEKRVERPWR